MSHLTLFGVTVYVCEWQNEARTDVHICVTWKIPHSHHTLSHTHMLLPATLFKWLLLFILVCAYVWHHEGWNAKVLLCIMCVCSYSVYVPSDREHDFRGLLHVFHWAAAEYVGSSCSAVPGTRAAENIPAGLLLRHNRNRH